MPRHALIFSAALAMMNLIAGCRCSQNDTSTGAATTESPEQKLIARGKVVYNGNCISCHNSNPKMPGSQGPEVFGSSQELLTARLVAAKYPDGYKPKRESRIMPALPHLEPEIAALTAYLNAP